MIKKITIVILAIALILLAFRELGIYSKILKRVYPQKYAEYIEKYSEKYEVEKEWIFALIKSESNFKENSISQSGAVRINADNGKYRKRNSR